MQTTNDMPVFRSLGWLDRYLAAWVLLAMAAGLLLGNFVPGAQDALNQGRFAGVSVPIGEFARWSAEEKGKKAVGRHRREAHQPPLFSLADSSPFLQPWASSS